MFCRIQFLAACLISCVSAGAGAQQVGLVTGAVFDSIANAPVVGATVQAAGQGTQQRLLFGSVTDSLGRFRIESVPVGDYVVGFDHPTLRALGIETPRVGLSVLAGGTAEVKLATPSPRTMRVLRCGTGTNSSGEGLIVGFVRDADTQVALADATVDVRWNEIVIVPGKAAFREERVFTVVQEDGAYAACGVPTDARLSLQVTAPNYSGGRVEIELPPGGAARQDLTVANSSTITAVLDNSNVRRPRGTAVLTGNVKLKDGRTAGGARLRMPELGLETSADRNGVFRFENLPGGSWMVEANTIGWEPVSGVVSLSGGHTGSVSLTFDATLALLGTVLVEGERTRITVLLERLIKRRLMGGGSIFVAGDPALVEAQQLTDVLRSARGFTIKREEDGSGVTVTGRGSGSVTSETGKCAMGIYINGEPMSRDFKDIDRLLQPKDVLAVEAYNSFATTPMEYRNQYTCGAVIFWTKR